MIHGSRWQVVLVAWSAGLVTSACAAPPVAVDSTALNARLLAEIGEATCTADAQCRSLAAGHKACGGPEVYLPWSTKVSNEARLRALAAEFAAARRAEEQQAGRVSDCSMVVDPGARCEAGRCVPAGRGGAALVR
jgi:hypothetical protein